MESRRWCAGPGSKGGSCRDPAEALPRRPSVALKHQGTLELDAERARGGSFAVGCLLGGHLDDELFYRTGEQRLRVTAEVVNEDLAVVSFDAGHDRGGNELRRCLRSAELS